LIESAFWLADPVNARGGFIRIKGWCFVDRNWCRVEEAGGIAPAGVDIVVSTDAGRQVFENLRPFEDRPDVAATNQGAPADCGFCFVVPIEGRPIPNEIEVRVKYRNSVIAVTYPESLLSNLDLRTAARMLGIQAAGTAKLENLLLNEYERIAGTIVKQSQPITLYIDPSFACNLKCPHCISESLRSQRFKRPVMKQDMYDHILEVYGSRLIAVIFSLWGEPLLNRRLGAFVRAAKDRGIYAEMSTNLSVPMSNERLEDIVSAGFDEIRLSIDGATQENYEKYRVGGSLDLVLNNLQRMVEVKRRLGLQKPVLKWQFLIWPWNRHEIAQAAEMAKDIGVDMFYAFPGDPWSEIRDPRPRMKRDDTIALHPDSRQRMRRNRDERLRNRQPVGCGFLDHALAINSDGVVHPCCYVVEPKDAVAHVLDRADGGSVFNAPGLANLRRFVSDAMIATECGPSPCVSCGLLEAGHIEDTISFDQAIILLQEASRAHGQ
jgi:MoaA/NifB/PqqE/SkfB family radical SAM enzyme